MKFGSQLAISGLITRRIVGGKLDWKDALLAAYVAKNELIEKDGDIRRLLEGRTENEIAQLKAALNEQLPEEDLEDPEDLKGPGIRAAFKRIRKISRETRIARRNV